ncbi:olfactory receptor 2D3-like [Eublepharis macularius]|uniref:Olfactory receptor n=1 Tax=Eublepharis macularius TaxID=481883 RepID=A0AA97LC16_EUBMA|nr:olfactory receptor 2D3-like [Eublepharis macularius]
MGTENFTSTIEFIMVGLTNNRKTQILLFFLILFIYLFTLVANLMIIILVRRNSHLHTPMYFFLTNLSGLEMCHVTTTMPQMMTHLLTGNGSISFARCMAQMAVVLSLGGTECFLLGVMAYDRYLAICRPLVYAIAMGKWQQLCLALASWLSAFFLALVTVLFLIRFPFCGSNYVNHFYCEIPVVMKLVCGDIRVTEAMLFFESAVGLVTPLIVILISYGLILSTVIRMQSTSGRQKAFSTCASHMVVVTIFYGTLLYMYLKPQAGTSPDRYKHTATIYAIVTPLLNPIIYTLRNKDIHKAVNKMLQRKGF